MTHASLRLAASTLALAGALSATEALAEGVLAGTLIENTASATYSDGTTTQTVESNKVTVKVDELLDVVIASQDASAVAIADTAVLTFEITNTGNGPESFKLTANPTVSGNDFDGEILGIAIDSDGDGLYDATKDHLLTTGETTAELDPDQSLTVFVIVRAPAGMADGNTSEVNLLAQAVTGTGAAGTSFAGQGKNGSDAVVGTTGADADTNGALIARLVAVTLTKSASIADPFGGSEPVPGATITYTISASVSGTGTVTGLHVTDSYPTGTTYTAGSLSLDSAALTDAADGDGGKATATGIDVNLGSVAAGTTHSVSFDVVIK